MNDSKRAQSLVPKQISVLASFERLSREYAGRDLWAKSLYTRRDSRILFYWRSGRPGILIPGFMLASSDPQQISEHFKVENFELDENSGPTPKFEGLFFGPSDDMWDIELFSSLVEAILPSVESSDDIVLTLRTKVEAWAKILSCASVQPDLRAKIVGLWGELSYLYHFVINDGPGSLTSWRGPDAGRHDFEFGAESVEAKTTTSATSFRAKINGLSQLEQVSDKRLYLVYLRVDWSPDGYTVADMIRHLERLFDISSNELFREKLNELGYEKWPVSQIESFRFIMTESLKFSVDKGFPRIISSALPTDVDPSRLHSVQYEITLPAQDAIVFPLSLPLGSTNV